MIKDANDGTASDTIKKALGDVPILFLLVYFYSFPSIKYVIMTIPKKKIEYSYESSYFVKVPAIILQHKSDYVVNIKLIADMAY